MQIKKVGILYHPLVETTRAKAQELVNFLKSRGVEAWTSSAWETEKANAGLDGTDLILTTGGDGTILRAAQVTLRHQIPIVGINMGNLGFLTECKADQALNALERVLNGQGWLDERMMLEARIVTPGSYSNPPDGFQALNDVVLARGAIARLIQINMSIDDRPITAYRADGLILSTATGSTGYAMAAGGPVIYPQSTDMLLAPIISHLSWSRSLVLPPSSTVKMQLITIDQATLSIDGHTNIALANGTEVIVKPSQYKTRFLRLEPRGTFFHFLEQKLRGKK